MWNKPTDEELHKLPPLYSTKDTPLEHKIVHMKFFFGAWTWYACEYDEESQRFFGYVHRADLPDLSEWGYFSLDELDSVNIRGFEVDRDLYWQSRKFKELGYGQP